MMMVVVVMMMMCRVMVDLVVIEYFVDLIPVLCYVFFG